MVETVGKTSKNDEVIPCWLTLNAEHNKLLNILKSKTGKEKREIIRDGIRLALSRRLEPTQYKWVKKNHRVFKVELPVEEVTEAKKLSGGKLTPLAVSGILEMSRSEAIQRPEVTKEDIERIRIDLEKLSHSIQLLGEKLAVKEAPKPITSSTTAAKAVRDTLRQLIEQLDYFKKGTEADRKKFCDYIDPKEVGYITSVLRALFDEEGFQRWVLATEFTMGEKKNE